MKTAAIIISLALAAVGLLWAFLVAALCTLFVILNRGGGWRNAFVEFLNEADPQRLALGALGLVFGLIFLTLGMALLRGGDPPT